VVLPREGGMCLGGQLILKKCELMVQGGAISYAAAVLSALGVRSCVVTGN
jgi:hypothetical protein